MTAENAEIVLSIVIVILFFLNCGQLWAYLRLEERHKDVVFKYNKLLSSFEHEVETRVATVHAQWKSYVNQIAKPGQA